MRHRRRDSHLITGEEMNASCLGRGKMEKQWGGRGDMPEEEKKKGKRRNRSSQSHQKKATVGTVE